jgi:class 3 adenylate cyclase
MTESNKTSGISSDEILEIDRITDNFIDTHYRSDPQSVQQNLINMLTPELPLRATFIHHIAPRTFDGQDRKYVTLFSEGLSNSLRTAIEKAITDSRSAMTASETHLSAKIKDDIYICGMPMHLGEERNFIGIMGGVSSEQPTGSYFRLLCQIGSRLDTYIHSKNMLSERHTVIGKVNKILHKKGIKGIGKVLLLMTELTGMSKGAVVFIEDEASSDVPIHESKVGFVYVHDGQIIHRESAIKKLNLRLGRALINYDIKGITDSNTGMRILGILERNDKTGEENRLPFHCKDLVNRQADEPYNVGKLFLIGEREMDPTDLSLMEAAGLQIDTRITNYHEQKKALGRSLHPDQIDFFLTYPKIARWFFENPREETIAMVFTDICGYTDLTRKLGDPRKTIEGARNWILKEKELTLKHGGFFDKEVGDCAVSLFGPPFCAISLDALQRVQSIEEIKELIRNNQSEPHLYAYQAIMYALESLEVVKTYSIGKHQLNISVGVEVGDVAIGDLTGDIGKLTAMGDSMNLAARLQGFAKQGQIIIGPNCARLIRIYKKESYHSELPFDVVKSGQARLKGYTDKITYYQVTPKKDTNQFF